MGLKGPIFIGRIMTEQQISRTQAWLESLRPKPSPSPLLQLSSGRRWHGGRSLRSTGRPAGIDYRRAITDLSNLANDYGDAVKGSDKPDRLGRYAACKKGSLPSKR